MCSRLANQVYGSSFCAPLSQPPFGNLEKPNFTSDLKVFSQMGSQVQSVWSPHICNGTGTPSSCKSSIEQTNPKGSLRRISSKKKENLPKKIYCIYCMRPFFSASSSFCLCPAEIPAGESMRPSESTYLGAPRPAPKVWAHIWGCRQPWGETTVSTALKFWLCRLKERVQEVLHSPGIWVPSNLICTACRACTAPGLLSPLQRASSLVHYSGLQGK